MQGSHSHHTLQDSSLPNLSRVNTIRSQKLPKDRDRHQGRRRVFAYYGHALIVFNVYGIPLSFGPYLEYYYNSRFPTTSFDQLTTIPACQILCIFSVSALAPQLYRCGTFYSALPAGILIAICFAISPIFDKWWLVLIIRGIFMGSMLGILRGVGLLCLASHYRNNFPLVSTQSGVAAMVGAASYTLLAWAGLRHDHYKALEMANFGLSLSTLLVATVLLQKARLCPNLALITAQPERTPRKPGNIMFHAGYLFVFFSSFLWPIFAVVLVSSSPSNQFPEFGAYVLLSTFAAGVVSSIYSGSAFARRKLGPLNIFISSSIVAGCCTLSPVWAPYYYISLAWGCLYGLMLGSLLTLHIKVTTVFHGSGTSYHPDMLWGFQVVSILTGLCAGAGTSLAGVFVSTNGDFKVVFTVCGGLMVVGGGLMGWGRWKRASGWRAAI
jgi:hypothetical protein